MLQLTWRNRFRDRRRLPLSVARVALAVRGRAT